MIPFFKTLGLYNLDRLNPKAVHVATIVTLMMLQFGCKAHGSGVTAATTDLSPTFSCGANKTFYFHWMSEAGAKGWLNDAGAPPALSVTTLQGASSPLYPLSQATISTLIRYYTPNENSVIGPGVYLASEPTLTYTYGDTLLIFRYRDNKGKGQPCEDWSKDLPKHLERNVQAKGSSDLPLLASYWPSKGYFIGPRAPMAARGESVVFSVPQEGDAEAFADEIINQVSGVDAMIDTYQKLYQNTQWTVGSCVLEKTNGSKKFLRELYCRTFVNKLLKFLAQSKVTRLSATAKTGLDSLISTFSIMSLSQDLMVPMKRYHSDLAAPGGSPD
ncbi:MAG: hypothetical protein NTZ90_09515 [Proteobacteria bacterium]|nr:hypothetical protein [Pseudomonadota bacterium]